MKKKGPGKYDKYLLMQSAGAQYVCFDLYLSRYELGKFLDHLPRENEIFKMISPAGGWSSCSLVMWIATQCVIHGLLVTTLRVGQKELDAIVALKKKGAIENVEFLLSGLAKENKVRGKDYGYSQNFEQVCERAGIKYRYVKNHSKVILLDTDKGKFVIETSSNFNENPKIEQFSFEKSEELYDFYKRIFDELLGVG
ncbi:hypothetical protein [Anaeromassilibacillus senegalensis]|uniref:hypothetical protein n=1 Tax=Anaeromassilibacillus senegalensis TaxID=1673717 RepID=UPI0006816591|nr:hypothetical protein [Anaeromassilibacillus senegalensis]